MKLTLTPKELCARLGITKTPMPEDVWFNGIDLRIWTVGKWQRILSINDKIELDECEKCRQPKEAHNMKKGKSMGHPFKPRPAIVRDIKLVETCECGKPKVHHHLTHEKMEMDDDTCEGYKPVQNVEITTEG